MSDDPESKRIIEIMQACGVSEYRIHTTLGEVDGKPTLFDELRVFSGDDYNDQRSWATANEFVNPTRALLKELERLTMGGES